jgi:hypothetical protein
MVKTFVVATLAVIGLGISSQSVFAGHRSRCCQPQPACCGAVSCCSTGTPAAAPTTAQVGSGYQSFSYEPGASAATPVAAPVSQVRPSSRSFYDQIRGDRKARGIY